jgi:hypothetical protein
MTVSENRRSWFVPTMAAMRMPAKRVDEFIEKSGHIAANWHRRSAAGSRMQAGGGGAFLVPLAMSFPAAASSSMTTKPGRACAKWN